VGRAVQGGGGGAAAVPEGGLVSGSDDGTKGRG
jgi:hypothetical protein